MKIRYRLSDATRTALFVETGVTHPADQAVEVDPQALSREDRAFLVGLSSVLSDSVTLKVPYWLGGEFETPFTFDRIAADLADILPAFRTAHAEGKAAIASAQLERAQRLLSTLQSWDSERAPDYPSAVFQRTPLWDELLAAHSATKQRVEAQRAERTEQRRLEVIAEAEEAARRDAEKAAWIAEHGSEYLRKAHGAGYDCQRLYVKERGTAEFPDYVIDFENRADWHSRACPSEKALTEALAVGGTVVWLTRPPFADDEGYWEAGEAVVVREYLGKYDLIKQF